ncbi:hypothetical protein ACFQJ5_17285 [Halomicroarcula sp. GCM10025324]|uniref:hypothetical protein n=1 Tax=Haloarcula TaxID=2237 RepID=UPI0023E770D1|nr:hypothetical protein [Halomicroarcula sp. ZS-22-S1]
MSMKNRTAGVLIGILAVVCLGLIFSAVYPLTTSDPHAATPPGDRFTVSDTDSYTASGRLVVDGQVRLAFEGFVTSDGVWYQKVVDDDVVSEAYQPTANETVYHRLSIEGSDEAKQRRELITEDEGRELVREGRNGERATFIVEENGTGVTQPVSGTASVFVNSLFLAGYEAKRRDSSAVTVYEPQSGWYDGLETYHITGASGTVRADTDTHVVKSADVTWDVTAPAGTYAEYVLVASLTDEPTSYRISFEFDQSGSDPQRPTWVGETDST